jgi:hypothetical protein
VQVAAGRTPPSPGLGAGHGAGHGLIVQPRWLREGLPKDKCRALVVDLDSVAPDRRALRGLVKELGGRAHAYPVAAFGYGLGEDDLRDLRAAGVQVFQHGLRPELFTAITEPAPRAPSDGFSAPSP